MQARLQRRMGMICAITGWSVEATPLAIILNSRSRRLCGSTRRRVLETLPPYFCYNYNTLDAGEGKCAPLFGE